ncbi:MAG: MotA/TolQ/ExbB proton channel family protein, partial [Gemmataceae bacterium]
TAERLGRLLIGPEQIACYCFATWAGLILLRRELEVRRQRRALGMELVPTDEGSRILPEDARPLLRKMDQNVARRGPFILANMVRLALGKYAISHAAPDVGEVVRTQADVEMGRMVSSMSTVQYLAWAIPAIGFVGTVRGLAGSFTMASSKEENLSAFLDEATKHLNFAFDCTLVALVLSLIVMYLLHTVQRDEETLIIDCQQYCQEHLLLRLYDPKPEPVLQ